MTTTPTPNEHEPIPATENQYKTVRLVGGTAPAAAEPERTGLPALAEKIACGEQAIMNLCMDFAVEIVNAGMEMPAGIDMFAGAPDIAEAGGPGQAPNIMGPAASLAKMQIAGPMAVAMYERVRRELDAEIDKKNVLALGQNAISAS